MTDRDVVARVAALCGNPRIYTRQRTTPAGTVAKPIYQIIITRRMAVEWTMTIYALLGQRRRARARELLERWRGSPYVADTRKYFRCKRGHGLTAAGSVYTYKSGRTCRLCALLRAARQGTSFRRDARQAQLI